MKIFIRASTEQDLLPISELIKANTESVIENGYSDLQKEIWIKSNTPEKLAIKRRERKIFCGEIANELVGVIGLKKNEVMGLYVNPKKRGLGIGRQLLEHVEEYARTQRIKELTLTSTPSGKGFYEKAGYKSKGAVLVEIEGVAFRETAMKKEIKIAANE